MKTCSILYVIRKLQTKTTMRYHYTPIRMAKIKTTYNAKCWHGYGAIGTLIYAGGNTK